MDNKKFAMSQAIRDAYKRGEEEETMAPLVRVDAEGNPIGRIQDGDGVIFYDIRGEREIELTEAFVKQNFDKFPIKDGMKTSWATMINYSDDLDVRVAFPTRDKIENTLTEIISKNDLKQAKIAESEKAIHLNYFFTGKNDTPFPNEDRFVIESPVVEKNYDEKPEMNSEKVADKIIDLLSAREHNFILSNFANVDVVGHIENREAILKAVNAVDSQLGRIVKSSKENGYFTIITSDHGSVEDWLYEDGTINTGHTNSPVHLVCIPPNGLEIELKDSGSLIDIAPTVLDILGLDRPREMTGTSLIEGLSEKCKVNLIITDGWGERPASNGNLVYHADTPHMDSLINEYPHITITASGEWVGLPKDAVGNSEAGHTHLGAGRVIKSDKVRIRENIETNNFMSNEAFLAIIKECRKNKSALHLTGIVSFFSSHGSIDYLTELLKLAKIQGIKNVYVHGFLGRRGEKPESGAIYTQKIEEKCAEFGVGTVASIIGRYWALDREENWDRIEKTYNLLVKGDGEKVH